MKLSEEPPRYGTKAYWEWLDDQPQFTTSFDSGHDHTVTIPKHYFKNAAKALVPLSGVKSDYKKNPGAADLWAAAAAVAMGASAYHGYKRNEPGGSPIGWALWWGFWGALVPIITVPIALAQGFAEPKQPEAVEGYGSYYQIS
jgi:hypothetical protein